MTELERRIQKAREEFSQYPEWVQKMSVFQGGETALNEFSGTANEDTENTT